MEKGILDSRLVVLLGEKKDERQIYNLKIYIYSFVLVLSLIPTIEK